MGAGQAAGRLPGEGGAPGQGFLNNLGPRRGLWELAGWVLGNTAGGDGPEQDAEGKQAWREARAWTSQRWALSEAQVRRWPDMTAGLGQPRSPLCPLERTMDSPYSPLFRRRETLLLHGVPPLTLQWQLEDIVST